MKDVVRLVAVILVCQLPPVPKTAPARDFGRKHPRINGGDGDDNDDDHHHAHAHHHHHPHHDCYEDSSSQRFQQNIQKNYQYIHDVLEKQEHL